MVISIYRTNTTPKSSIVTASPMPIMEETARYIVPQAQIFQDVEQIPVRPFVKLHANRPGPSSTTWGKHTRNKKRKGKETTPPTPPPREDDEDSENRNMLSPYIPRRRFDARRIRIPKRSWYPLVAPTMLGVRC